MPIIVIALHCIDAVGRTVKGVCVCVQRFISVINNNARNVCDNDKTYTYNKYRINLVANTAENSFIHNIAHNEHRSTKSVNRVTQLGH